MPDYLDEPLKDESGEVVKIEGTPLGWTYQGAIRLLGHYQDISRGASVGSCHTQSDLQHLHFLVFRLKEAIKFYEEHPQYIQK